MSNIDVSIWERYTLTIEEASKYFCIGEKKLRKIAEENRTQTGSFSMEIVCKLSENSLRKSLMIQTLFSDFEPVLCCLKNKSFKKKQDY